MSVVAGIQVEVQPWQEGNNNMKKRRAKAAWKNRKGGKVYTVLIIYVDLRFSELVKDFSWICSQHDRILIT